MSAPIVRYYSSMTSTPLRDVEKSWRSAKRVAACEGHKHDWSRISTILKESIGASELKSVAYLGTKASILSETPDFAILRFGDVSGIQDSNTRRLAEMANGVLPVPYDDLAAGRAPGMSQHNRDLVESSYAILSGVDAVVPAEKRTSALKLILEFEDGRTVDDAVVTSIVEAVDKGFKVDDSDWSAAGVTPKKNDQADISKLPTLPKLDEIEKAQTQKSIQIQSDLAQTPPAPETPPEPSPEPSPEQAPEEPTQPPQDSGESELPDDQPPPSDKEEAPEETSPTPPQSPAAPEFPETDEDEENDALANLSRLRKQRSELGRDMGDLTKEASDTNKRLGEARKRPAKGAGMDKYLRLSGAIG